MNGRDINVLANNGVDVKESIGRLGGEEAYNDTIDTFLELSGVQLRNLKSYKESGDIENYTILVHSIKSEAKILGFSQLADMALAHELSAKNRNTDYISFNYSNLEKEFNRVIQLVRTYVGIHNVDTNNNVVSIKPKQEKEKAILVTDDSEIVRNFVTKIIDATWKFEAIQAKDGFEAINIINKNPKIVGMLLDLNMPNLSGDKVLKYLDDYHLFDKITVAVVTGEEDINRVMSTFKFPIVNAIQKERLDKSAVEGFIKTVNNREIEKETKRKAA